MSINGIKNRLKGLKNEDSSKTEGDLHTMTNDSKVETYIDTDSKIAEFKNKLAILKGDNNSKLEALQDEMLSVKEEISQVGKSNLDDLDELMIREMTLVKKIDIMSNCHILDDDTLREVKELYFQKSDERTEEKQNLTEKIDNLDKKMRNIQLELEAKRKEYMFISSRQSYKDFNFLLEYFDIEKIRKNMKGALCTNDDVLLNILQKGNHHFST